MTETTAVLPAIAHTTATRWVQLGLGLVCMMAISSPQCVWTLFTKPIGSALGVSPASLQVTFSLLIVLQTFFSPFQGWLVDKFGPRLLIATGGVLSGLSLVLASYASSLTMLYLTYGLIGGLGTGIVYVGVVGQMVCWFPDRRGFAAGTVAAGYGMGAIVTTFPITNSLAAVGYQMTLLQYGAIFALIGLVAALALKPAPMSVAATTDAPGADTGTMLRSPIFWLMFVMMTLMSTSGLTVTSQMATFAGEFGITKAVVWGLAALPLALRACQGSTAPSERLDGLMV
jgi:OFA family oxalate/formate antiporter-like MFS transporter